MSDKNHNVLRKSYQPTTLHIGNSYQPVLIGNAPKNIVPPKGGTGARSVVLKVVTANSEKK